MVEVGQVISGKYKLLRLLGDGGMGSVYEAEHLRLGTHVAIKVLHSDLARRSGLMDRFLQEARVSAQIQSPHVVHVTDVESTPDGIAYLVMELLQGEPLSVLEKRERVLPVVTACEYTSQILQALEAAHSLGVVHRDLKPDNVFVTFEGGRPVIKLIDFGIAKLKRAEGAAGAAPKNLTVAGMLMGTPEYMAPEQAYSATDVDARADIYSVGVILYEMLSGHTPAQGDDPRVVVLKVERGEVAPLVHVAPSVPPEVAGLVHRAMAPRRDVRFASAAEMRIALDAVIRRPGTARIAPPTGVGMGPHVLVGTGQGGPHVLVGTGQGGPSPHPPAAAPIPHAGAYGVPANAPAATPQEQRTGTVMGAPAEAALMPASPPYRERERVPPPRHEKKSGTGLIIALAVVALLLGAGAVVAYWADTNSPAPVALEPLPTVTTLTAPAAPATTAPTTATTASPVSPGPVTPLTPPPPQNTPPPARPHPSSSAAPHPSSSAAPSNAVSPFPPFPSAFPGGFPSAFPSAFAIPSGFPTFQVPSGFPPFPPVVPPP